MNIFYIAKRLQGEVIGPNSVACPDVGKPSTDRSVLVTVNDDGWTVDVDSPDFHRSADYVRGIMLEVMQAGPTV